MGCWVLGGRFWVAGWQGGACTTRSAVSGWRPSACMAPAAGPERCHGEGLAVMRASSEAAGFGKAEQRGYRWWVSQPAHSGVRSSNSAANRSSGEEDRVAVTFGLQLFSFPPELADDG